MPFPSTCFNVIVSFETIEHLEYPEVYLEEICRVLTPRGTLIISTPNREVTNPGGSLEDRPKNPFHEREFSSVEFKALLENYFNQIRYYGQGFCRIGDGTLARRLKKLVNLQLSWRVISWPDGAEEQPTYILAVCRGKKIGF